MMKINQTSLLIIVALMAIMALSMASAAVITAPYTTTYTGVPLVSAVPGYTYASYPSFWTTYPYSYHYGYGYPYSYTYAPYGYSYGYSYAYK